METPQKAMTTNQIKSSVRERGSVGPLAQSQALPGWKRFLDLALVLATAPIWLPLMFLISVLIKLVSPGPALFRQERIGHRGQRFTCFKFRTMRINAHPEVHRQHFSRHVDANVPMRKLDREDPRLIPCGLWLRSLGLDEVPQLFNVLRGEMSLVGPRPCLPYECANYAPRHLQRLEAVPGLTGLWQVNGKNLTTFEEMIDLDICYARSKSLWLDLKIISRTIPAIVSQTRSLREESPRDFQEGGLEQRGLSRFMGPSLKPLPLRRNHEKAN
jgi:lipopolysaccharide/colanic/teichoic acid biosynthesis glycosyltransferase